VKKIQIIILVGAGIFSFAGTFAVTLLVKRFKSEVPVAAVAEETKGQAGPVVPKVAGPTGASDSSVTDVISGGMTEKQLQNLIYDIRSRMTDYKRREKELKLQEERLRTTRLDLQDEIARLDELRLQLTTTIATLKEQEASLQNSMLEIGTVEKSNIQSIANRYDKMDVSQASKIMVRMVSNNQLNDAAKILYYMSERTSGKLLGEIGNTQPEVAVILCKQLKRMRESL